MDALWAELALVPGAEAAKHRAEIEEALLKPTCELARSWMLDAQQHWSRPTRYESMLALDPSPSTTSLQFVRSGLEGRVIGYSEVVSGASLHDLDGSSLSLHRPVSTQKSFVRGSTSSMPFRPGGLDDAVAADEPSEPSSGQLRTVPPGFSRGLSLSHAPLDESVPTWRDELVQASSAHLDRTVITVEKEGLYKIPETVPQVQNDDALVDELLPEESLPRIFQSVTKAPSEERREWAHMIHTSKQMTNFHELVPVMAHDYPFELDTFQKQAVYHLEQNDSVFVAAHTSAGKTVVAEYAIALASKHMTRCIYTSPIKALSNQKFREFKHTFGAENVGILTGDVQINPEATCLIMTTEILRSMLYRGADLIRDVEFVIFDEVHYVNDQERGVVWEEVIILLPAHINIVLLSATVPNTREFADWVGRTKKKDVYVISTPKRPVPLEHFLFAGKELYKVVDAQGRFYSKGVHDAVDVLRSKQEREGTAPGAAGPQRAAGAGVGRRLGGAAATDKSLWVHLVGLLRKRSLLPVVVFVFSKRRCEEYADALPNTDLCHASEKSEVHVVIERSLSRLKDADRNLPQIARMRSLLSRGIGVHHSGLLPIVKELVELLFQRGLVKVLFATETFAMGVNMPARSVVFSGIRKHDGQGFRNLLPGEYTQMSGRAGRRGLDATGVVIVIAEDPDVHTLNRMMLGQSTKLKSQFRITYSMVLNLLRIEALKVEEMIKRSFSENATQRLRPEQEKKLKSLQSKRAAMEPELAACTLPLDELERLYDLSVQAVRLSDTCHALAAHHSQGTKLLAPGRVVLVREGTYGFAPAFLVRALTGQRFLALLALTPGQRSSRARSDALPLWISPAFTAQLSQSEWVAEAREIPLSSVVLVTSITAAIPSASIQSRRPSALRRALELLRAPMAAIHAQLVAASEPAACAVLGVEVDWSRLRRMDFQDTQRERNAVLAELAQVQGLMESPEFLREYQVMHRRKQLELDMARVSASMSSENLDLLPDYHQRIDVLKALRFIDPDSETVLLKGRVACEIRIANELILTELLLDNTFVEYAPEEIAALLSVFHFKDKTSIEPELTPTLREGYQRIVETADRVAAVQLAHQLNAEDDASTMHMGLMQVVYEWARGMQFHDIMQLTDIGEGTIVRCITRLDETFREVRDASRVIGDMDLLEKMETCQQLVRRDIVFAASLYF
ncbi:Antiviral helicase ski2 [Malassezia caprae]|uniref:Antiviral helicase ski2 n=1 Tax=Malassezia caprae TaxID=1381934 RepID=A0AAF0E3Y0_9BASI|nr:Antiviral helicase ski2 [Malassezia caprae]